MTARQQETEDVDQSGRAIEYPEPRAITYYVTRPRLPREQLQMRELFNEEVSRQRPPAIEQ